MHLGGPEHLHDACNLRLAVLLQVAQLVPVVRYLRAYVAVHGLDVRLHLAPLPDELHAALQADVLLHAPARRTQLREGNAMAENLITVNEPGGRHQIPFVPPSPNHQVDSDPFCSFHQLYGTQV